MKHLTYLALGNFKASYLDRVDEILELVTGSFVDIVRVKGNDNHWTDKELRHAVHKTEVFVQDPGFGDFHLDGLFMKGGGHSVEQVSRYVDELSGKGELHTALLQWGDYDSDRVFTISPNPTSDVDFAHVAHDWLL